jgi:hypothetical protein
LANLAGGLCPGVSVGHYRVSAGTLGGFVRRIGEPGLYILSNNHVLANENNAVLGDPVLHPARWDGGNLSSNIVARLAAFEPLQDEGNSVDAAIALLEEQARPNDLLNNPFAGVCNTSDLRELLALIGQTVRKIGRTTGLTEGRVRAVEIEDITVDYGFCKYKFSRSSEIEGLGQKPFSKNGDSGSIVYDHDNRAVGLLFAGSRFGGDNGKGLTYLNPIGAVLRSLNVELV